MASEINIPTNTRFLDETGKPSTPWLLWLLNPRVLTFDSGTSIPVESGGTGSSGPALVGALLVGNGSVFAPAATLPASAFPALSGDITTTSGSLTTTLATVNADVGSWGTGTNVASFTVNGKGLVTAAANTPITGSVAAFSVGSALTVTTTATVTGAFGCNGKPAQTSAAANVAIAAVAGAAYTAVEQGMLNDLKALVNQIRAALVADGVMV